MRNPVLLSLLVAVLFAGCLPEDGPDPDDAGPDNADAGEDPLFVDGDGFPELTGPITTQGAVAPGDTLIAQVPVDADTAYVRLAVEDYATSISLVQNFADEGGPSTTFQADIVIPDGTSAAPGTYYLTVDLCSSAQCIDPFRRVTYERVGEATTYTRVDFDSPPLTQVGDPRDSGIAINTFELQ